MTAEAPRFLSIKEAAERLGGHVSERTLRRLAREGKFPVRRVGRRHVIAEAVLMDWINRPDDVAANTYARPIDRAAS